MLPVARWESKVCLRSSSASCLIGSQAWAQRLRTGTHVHPRVHLSHHLNVGPRMLSHGDGTEKTETAGSARGTTWLHERKRQKKKA